MAISAWLALSYLVAASSVASIFGYMAGGLGGAICAAPLTLWVGIIYVISWHEGYQRSVVTIHLLMAIATGIGFYSLNMPLLFGVIVLYFLGGVGISGAWLSGQPAGDDAVQIGCDSAGIPW